MLTFWDRVQANVGSLLGNGTTADEEQARSDAADARLAELNREDAPRYGPAWQAQADYNQTREESAYGMQVAESIEDEFEAGYDEGRENIREFGAGVGRVVGDVAGSAASGVTAGAWEVFKKNWWWIVPALVVAFFVYGGARLLPKRKTA